VDAGNLVEVRNAHRAAVRNANVPLKHIVPVRPHRRQDCLRVETLARSECNASMRPGPHDPARASGRPPASAAPEDRNFKRCFSDPWPGCVGHLRLSGQRSESAAGRRAAQKLPRRVYRRGRLRVNPQNLGAFAGVRKPRTQRGH